MFDVVIVGAGPAGTAAAYDLLEKGLTVLLLDKYAFPRKKACAGGITPKGYRLFKYDISSMIRWKTSCLKINHSAQKTFSISDQNALCYMTRRQELDQFSLNTVMAKGARFRVIRQLRSIQETASDVQIQADSQNFKCRFLIGADGANSKVRRLITKTKFYKKQFAIEADIYISRPDHFKMEFDFSRVKNGYFWIFPKNDHLNMGIYSTRYHKKPKIQDLEHYVQERIGNIRLDALKGYPICTGGVQYQPDKNRILLVGDAAGLAEPLFGEGIYFALKSGQAAAAAILEAMEMTETAKDIYTRQLKAIQSDLRCYTWGASFFYKFPKLSFQLASIPFIKKRFARGYGNGDTLLSMLKGY